LKKPHFSDPAISRQPGEIGLLCWAKPRLAVDAASRGQNQSRQIGGTNKGTNMSKPMTRTQFIAALADAMGSDKKTANAALDAIAAVVAREVATGGAVTLPGLGKIVCRARPERQVRNPATGETVTKAADKQVKFTIAKTLKDSVNV
jgi:DNA-binding protein HU-beta